MYTIVFHKLVLKKDFKKISVADQKKILRNIEKKLKKSPETFGKPLKKSLKGLYRLRVGIYRVIYEIKQKNITVFVIHIGIRKDFLAYFESVKRVDE